MSARNFFSELFGSKSQVQITTGVNDEKRRVSISNSGRFRQKNKRRKQLQKDTFSPQSPVSSGINIETEINFKQSERVQNLT